MEQYGRDAEGRIFVVIIKDTAALRVVSDPVPAERTYAAAKYISNAATADHSATTNPIDGEKEKTPTGRSLEASVPAS